MKDKILIDFESVESDEEEFDPGEPIPLRFRKVVHCGCRERVTPLQLIYARLRRAGYLREYEKTGCIKEVDVRDIINSSKIKEDDTSQVFTFLEDGSIKLIGDVKRVVVEYEPYKNS